MIWKTHQTLNSLWRHLGNQL